MKRKIIGAGLFCLVLFAAILAGYWDMLSTEKLKIVRDEATQAVGEIADVVRPGSAPADGAASPAAAPSAAGTEAPAPADNAAAASAETPAETFAPPVTPPSATAPSATAPSETDAALQAPASPTPDAPANQAAETSAAAPATVPADASSATASEPAPLPAVPASDGVPETPAPSRSAGEVSEPLVLPTFDIVRVEPDGSTVLAGRAPAGSAIVLYDGKRRVAEEKAGAGGDFVVTLDERLSVGEHQLTLEATAPDGRAATSAETVIVSIPEKGRENELLAMVESPDQPSRLISIPAAPTPPAAEATRPAGDAATTAAGAGTETAALQAPVLPSAPSQGQSETELTLPLAPEPKAAAALPATPLAVEAVEIEGDQIYIAGRATGAASVRVYIDNDLLAAASKLTADRFLVTAKAPVRPGEHLVRADALDAAGAVIARVEVPFNRPEGRAMSAISAPATPTAAAPAASPAATPSPAVPTASSEVAAAPAEPTATPQTTAVATTAAEQSSSAAAAPATAAASSSATAATETAAVSVPAGSLNPSAAAPGEDVAVLRQPALEAVEARVIIRRGDTLWRISRNTYGRGARYTVIYLANGDQIRDPDRIYPGQVFRMPEDKEAAAPATPATPGQ